MLSAEGYNQLAMAAEIGRLDVVQYLVDQQHTLEENQAQSLLMRFVWYFVSIPLNIWCYFTAQEIKQDAPRVQVMLEARNYEAFARAAESGHLDVVRYLYEQQRVLDASKLPTMVQAGGYKAFHPGYVNCLVARLNRQFKKNQEYHQFKFSNFDT